MNQDADRLYNLLPSIYRQRDADMGLQLKALLRVITEQVNIVEADINQLYENWFIETCQDWVVPYIGDLIGYQQVHEAGELGDSSTVQGQQRNKILISRSEVANTIHYRRRRGTLALLEQLAHDVAGWPAYAVEYFKLLSGTQTGNYTHTHRARTIDIRHDHALYRLGSPFDTAAHTVDVRRIVSHHTVGRYNIPSVGLFVWRLKVYPVTETPAYCKEEVGNNCYTFSVLGNDVPLYTNVNAPAGQKPPVNERHFPNPITRRAFARYLDAYYGLDADGNCKGLLISTIEGTGRGRGGQRSSTQQQTHGGHGEHSEHGEHGGKQQQGHHDHHEHEHHEHQEQRPQSRAGVPSPSDTAPATLKPVEKERIVPADLSDWAYYPEPNQVAVDPELGRIIFPPGHEPREVIVSYFYAFSTDMGGGEYNRPLTEPAMPQRFHVSKTSQTLNTLKAALDAWEQWKQQNAQKPSAEQLPVNAVIEITDNGVYTEQIAIELEENENLQIRAANRTRPILRLVDWNENQPDVLKITGESGSRFTLDGLLVTGRPVQFEGVIANVHIRHCTLVPGWGIDSDCNAERPEEASLLLYHTGNRVAIEHTILGSILIYQDAVREEPMHLDISDSIVDATSEELNAIGAPEDSIAYIILNIARCTVFGLVLVHAIDTAENSIFQGEIGVARRQRGCMRFCSLAYSSRTPRRYNCQPDLVDTAVDARMKTVPVDQREAFKQREHSRIRPRFNSTLYGKPTYCQLALSCATEIQRGADDESEMGVFHDLYQPQRTANLRARLDDFTPAGMEAGIIYVS